MIIMKDTIMFIVLVLKPTKSFLVKAVLMILLLTSSIVGYMLYTSGEFSLWFSNQEALDVEYVQLSGNLYFDIIELDEDNEVQGINVHKYDMGTQQASPVIEGGTQFNLRPLSSTTVSFITNDTDSQGNSIQMRILLDTTTNANQFRITLDGHSQEDVAFSPDARYTAISLVKGDQANKRFDNRGIVVYDTLEDISISVLYGTSPQWLPDGTGFMYLAEDGIYQYDVAAQVSYRIYESQSVLDTTADIALSPNDDYVLLTQPLLDLTILLEVLTSPDRTLLELSTIETIGQQYTSVVFSPDGQYFAAVASNPYTKSTIDIYGVQDRTIVKTITVSDYMKGTVRLSDWSLLAVQPIIVERVTN